MTKESDMDSKMISSDNVKEEIYSPVAGEVFPISQIKDDVFASEAMGKGVYITPSENTVYAPFDGEIVMIANTKHAIGIKSEQGVEILIHIGIDTVELNGEGFKVSVKAGDKVKQGQELITFDRDFIIEKGYSLDIPVICTNGYDIEIKQNKNVISQDILFTTI